ncbi:ABC transporter ATP-binding protein [Caballeronia telluris]|uniref:Glutathione import ATP-binding protein GsiA n=1 Tax=Caballeronia telluris TaxID=326475 RepID=A0A158K8Y1_9BURK|nr:ABC transporter ATP-binding protein [Caballeronia telluris]SAL76990.1 oligopeptide/dipeptide ABC transporter ATPase [Caballeronia telluris]
MTVPVLSVSDLSTSFRVGGVWRSVVRGISFDIAPGETLAIVGESGSGKSVTALSIMQLTSRTTSRIQGSVRLNERELLGFETMREIRGNQIGMIFQEPMTSLNPVLPVGFQIAESLMLHCGLSKSAANAEAVRLLDKVRIPAAASRARDYPHAFSGGMRQRVMIALALACKPKLLIADEPTTALDVTIQAQVLDLIKSLQVDDGMSVLFITHDMGVVAEIADRVVVMYDGSQVESNTTEMIFREPSKPYTRALLSAVPRLGSMAGRKAPLRFPVVNRETGCSDVPAESPDTVRAGTQPVLKVSGLTTRFDIRSGLLGKVKGRVHAVENVSFAVQPGETLALVGESGCGKSTTGRSLMCLNEPLAGSVELDGIDLLKLKGERRREKRRGVQMIFQDPFASLNPRATVGAIIAEPLLANGLANRQDAHALALQLLRQVGLSPDMADRYPHEFSGGQRQRICIARALALEPKLIIADEAVSALDVSVKAQVVNLMLDLQARMGLAYLFISHDMAVVERISHRVAVMYLGEIVEIGPREAVFGDPQHPYTKRLLAAVPVADPGQRNRRSRLAADEIRSPIRAADYSPAARQYRKVSTDHIVMEV